MTINNTPPPPDPGCFWHGEEEPILPGAFRVCLECGHVYATLDEIIDEHRRAYAEAFPGAEPLLDEHARIYANEFCPVCVHDF